MIPTLLGDPRRAAVVALVSILGIALTLRADRESEPRANRLHRADRLGEAASIYAALVDDEQEDARLRYNLGTTLLRQGEAGAFDALAAAISTDDERLAVRAHYNMGLWSLIQSIMAPTTDSVLFHAGQAVEANKAALRLDPRHEGARWNLALARRILVRSAPEQGLMDPGDITGPDNIGERIETPNPMELANREGLDEVAVMAETESLAGEDLQPLTPVEANQILGRGHLDPSRMISKMLVRESRTRRARAIFFEGPPW
ncbi:MAG: hypothetical protein AB7T31_13845 [Gemmatimonadales bacterium]